MKRVRSEQKAARALADYLSGHGMTMDDYQALQVLAERPFYTADGTGEIIISEHQVYGVLAQAASLASASVRLARPEQIRTVLQVEDWRTGKTEPDGVWERFVRNPLTNQRGLRSNPYLSDFDATGELRFSEDILDQDKVRRFIEFCGREVGVGASRKLGWGRYEVVGWKAK